jgi:hypothetical protein
VTIWISVDKEMPPAFKAVEVRGSDTQGEWFSTAWWQPYRGKPPGNPRKHGRWMHHGKDKPERFGSYGDVDHWRPLQGTKG